ncbi:MAG: vWA domain-containing protein [Candidatus Paceibacterota bacterium]|jgi:uncharacterized protein with von Willebrand factor type A (vWA) domain
MKKSFPLVCCFVAMCLVSACGDGGNVSSQQTGQAGVSLSVKSAVKYTWLDQSASKSSALDENLLRKNIYLVLDCSSSMAESCGGGKTKINAAKEAINRFVSLIPEDTNLGFLTFEFSDVQEKIPLGIGNRKELITAVNRPAANGSTPLSKAVEMGYEKLREQALKQLGYGEYHLVVMTDGEANPGCDPGKIVDKILKTSPVVIHAIGINIGSGHSLNQPGRTIYKDAQNPKDLEDGLAEIAAESEKF